MDGSGCPRRAGERTGMPRRSAQARCIGKERTMATPLQKIAKEADRVVEEAIQDWMAVANLAYSSVDKKIEDAPRDYWLVALAGNLGWAVAGFFPVTAAIKIIVIGNAVLGAGAADKIAAETKLMPPSVDKLLAGRIAETADALETHFLNL